MATCHTHQALWVTVADCVLAGRLQQHGPGIHFQLVSKLGTRPTHSYPGSGGCVEGAVALHNSIHRHLCFLVSLLNVFGVVSVLASVDRVSNILDLHGGKTTQVMWCMSFIYQHGNHPCF